MLNTNLYEVIEEKDRIEKRTRPSFTKEQISKMTEWIDSHSHNPYPTESEKEKLSIATGLNLKQVSIWFTNTRKVNFYEQFCNFL